MGVAQSVREGIVMLTMKALNRARVFVASMIILGAAWSSISHAKPFSKTGATSDRGNQSDFRQQLTRSKAKPKKPKPSAFTGALQFWNEMAVTQAQQGIGAPTGYIITRLNYRASEQITLGVGQDFMTNYGGLNASGTSMNDIDDFFVSFAHRSIFTLPIGINFSTQQRLYAPTSPGSQRIGQIAQWRGYFTFSGAPAEKLSIDVGFQTRYYFQQFNTGTPADLSAPWDGIKTRYSGTEYARLKATTTVTYVWTEGFNSYFEGGLIESFRNAGIAPDTGEFIAVRRGSTTFAEAGVNYDFTSNLQASVGVTTDSGHDLINPARQFSLFRDDETNFFFSGRLSF